MNTIQEHTQQEQERKQINQRISNQRLSRGFVVLLIIALTLGAYFYSYERNSFELIKQILPEFIASLIIALAVEWYLLYMLKGDKEKAQNTNTTFINSRIINQINHITNLVTNLERELIKTPPWLVGGYQNLDQVEWISKVELASDEIVFVTFYSPRWINDHYKHLQKFLKNNDKSRILFFLPDVDNQQLIRDISSIIKYDESTIKRKINDSLNALRSLAKNTEAYERITIYKSPKLFPYTFQKFDRFIYFQINEMFRNDAKSYTAPFFVVDLNLDAENLKDFCNQEIENLKKLCQTSKYINKDI
ncbi:OST5 family protein [Xanthocytophaga agilis]|uniref:OST5 family protein n=1 Tax=Xanthocytophaga agilis TaxID=3048010 RepID=A0AAE3UIC9_9BACT|nr:OST5 family protein [Xanthocytophaga agilis]MDJ1503553.1 OST5 family protein [Xanthocytophaga agilis]